MQRENSPITSYLISIEIFVNDKTNNKINKHLHVTCHLPKYVDSLFLMKCLCHLLIRSISPIFLDGNVTELDNSDYCNMTVLRSRVELYNSIRNKISKA